MSKNSLYLIIFNNRANLSHQYYLTMINYFQTGNPSECCGCTSCANACPKHCIELTPDKEGFLYPKKNLDACIDCGRCERVCPFSEHYSFETTADPTVYAAYDKEHRAGSSSGGIFYTIAKYVIEERQGWVYGAAFDDNLQLKHIGVNNFTDLQKLRGSKYLQSAMGDTYSQIKTLLKDGHFVFFVGTPCQVAGLRAFLRNKEYDNLLVADLVCHGVPPQTLFNEHVKYLETKHKAKLVSYQFRKADGWGVCEIADFANPKKRKVLPSYELSPYLYSFMYAMTYRESCYECKFAKVPRQGDITLADFWGVEEFFPNIDKSKGVSMVLVNSPQGDFVWRLIEGCIETEQSNLHDGARNNHNLVNVSAKPYLRTTIFKIIENLGYNSVALLYFRPRHYFIKYIKNQLLAVHSKLPIFKSWLR